MIGYNKVIDSSVEVEDNERLAVDNNQTWVLNHCCVTCKSGAWFLFNFIPAGIAALSWVCKSSNHIPVSLGHMILLDVFKFLQLVENVSSTILNRLYRHKSPLIAISSMWSSTWGSGNSIVSCNKISRCLCNACALKKNRLSVFGPVAQISQSLTVHLWKVPKKSSDSLYPVLYLTHRFLQCVFEASCWMWLLLAGKTMKHLCARYQRELRKGRKT